MQPACDPRRPSRDGDPRRLPAPSPEALEAAAAMLRAAGEAGRLSLLLRLESGERSVTALAADEGEKLATVSARLKLLHAARLVTRRREARRVFYALADGHVARLLRDVLDHAAEGASSARAREGGPMTTCADPRHADHAHVHGPGCGHVAIRHGGHVDYLHDGHLHHPHGDHVDEHVIEVSGANPDACAPLAAGALGHDADHVHGPGCGHEAVPHGGPDGGHVCYLVGGRLHRPHDGHCDDHGPLEAA